MHLLLALLRTLATQRRVLAWALTIGGGCGMSEDRSHVEGRPGTDRLLLVFAPAASHPELVG